MAHVVEFFKGVADSVLEAAGEPVQLRKLLAQEPKMRVTFEEAPRSIALGQVPRWDRFGDSPTLNWPRRARGELRGWHWDGSGYRGFTKHCQAYAKLHKQEIVRNISCDIGEVAGLSSSKSPLERCATMDQFATEYASWALSEISEEALRRVLSHKEIRILHEPGSSDCFHQHAWDGRLFLSNSGGSHHFAAGAYIAKRLGIAVPLVGKLYRDSLCPEALADLSREYDVFAVAIANDVSEPFHKAMEAIRATWFWHYLPHPYELARAVLLPKTEPRSRRAAEVLRQAGFVDLCAHLAASATSPRWPA